MRMEPAIALRRKSVRSSTARRRRDAATALVVALAFVSVVWWLLTGPAVAIRSVSIAGYTRPDAPILARYVQRAVADGTLIDLPEARVRAALRPFPWVRDVVVSRDWPTGVAVRIVETLPIALAVPARGPSAIVSAEGRVLGLAGRGVERGLPIIRVAALPTALGAPLVAQSERDAVSFVQRLPTDAGIKLTDIASRGTGLVARLDSGLEVRLGGGTRIGVKAIALATVIARIPSADQRPPAYLDLHDPVRPAFGKDRASDGTPIPTSATASALRKPASVTGATGKPVPSTTRSPAAQAAPAHPTTASTSTRYSTPTPPPSLDQSSSQG